MQALKRAYQQALKHICKGEYRRADLVAIDKAELAFIPVNSDGEKLVQRATSVQYELLDHFGM